MPGDNKNTLHWKHPLVGYCNFARFIFYVPIQYVTYQFVDTHNVKSREKQFCSPSTPDISSRENKTNYFPRDLT